MTQINFLGKVLEQTPEQVGEKYISRLLVQSVTHGGKPLVYYSESALSCKSSATSVPQDTDFFIIILNVKVRVINTKQMAFITQCAVFQASPVKLYCAGQSPSFIVP